MLFLGRGCACIVTFRSNYVLWVRRVVGRLVGEWNKNSFIENKTKKKQILKAKRKLALLEI